jgi:holo-[acyl-carrier protein] synthase
LLNEDGVCVLRKDVLPDAARMQRAIQRHGIMGTVIGIGIDLEEIARVERVFAIPRALTRVFTPHEIAYCQLKRHRFQHLAARFAAKEAVFKALGTGLSGGLHWTDAEVRNEPSGKPYLILSGPAKALADRLGVHTILISLSHSRQYAIAQVTLLG